MEVGQKNTIECVSSVGMVCKVLKEKGRPTIYKTSFHYKYIYIYIYFSPRGYQMSIIINTIILE